MSDGATRIDAKHACTVDVWPSEVGRCVAIYINEIRHAAAMAYLTPDQTDALIRALAAARVELSKARPS